MTRRPNRLPLILSLFLPSLVYAFPNLGEIGAVRSELALQSNKAKSLSAAELGAERGLEGEPKGGWPSLLYDVINLSENDSKENVVKWLAIRGIDAVIHRCSMGTNGLDKEYKRRAAAAVHGNYRWGAYHFLRQDGSGRDQANWFIKKLVDDPNHPKAVLLVIDAEYRSGSGSPHPTLDQIVDCVRRIHELTGKYPGIYTGQDFLLEQFQKAHYDSNTKDLFQDTWLWVARYSASYKNLTFPSVFTPPWDRWLLWQVSDDRSPSPLLEGMKAEMNIFKGERSELATFWDANAWNYAVQTPLD
jgi:lysozyme